MELGLKISDELWWVEVFTLQELGVELGLQSSTSHVLAILGLISLVGMVTAV